MLLLSPLAACSLHSAHHISCSRMVQIILLSNYDNYVQLCWWFCYQPLGLRTLMDTDDDCQVQWCPVGPASKKRKSGQAQRYFRHQFLMQQLKQRTWDKRSYEAQRRSHRLLGCPPALRVLRSSTPIRSYKSRSIRQSTWSILKLYNHPIIQCEGLNLSTWLKQRQQFRLQLFCPWCSILSEVPAPEWGTCKISWQSDSLHFSSITRIAQVTVIGIAWILWDNG